MSQQPFTVAHQSFAGPLDVLLSLIEDKKMEITEISLGNVAEEFAQYVEQHTELPLYERSAAIVILATLMLIKSRTLLPSFVLTNEEELASDELQKRLALYAEVKKGAHILSALWRSQPLVGMRKNPTREIQFVPSSDLTLAGIHTALHILTQTLPSITKRDEATVEGVIRIEDMMDHITQRIQSAISASFKDMTAGSDRATTIVSFLAILELVRHGILTARQQDRFGDIHLGPNEKHET